MSHSYSCLLYHCVWSTKNRISMLDETVKQRLYDYIGGIVKKEGGVVLAIGGMEDHIHLLCSLPAPVPVAQLMRIIKTNSSKFIHHNFLQLSDFAWQEGYGIFSVSKSAIPKIVVYIQEQAEHHRNHSFDEEFIGLLKKHDLLFDARFVLG